MSTAIETLREQRCFDGTQGFYRHESSVCAGSMRFSVYVPPGAKARPVPAVYYLAGLTCTEETFPMKACAQRAAAMLDLVLVACDTSPRAARYPGDDASDDFGLGAGFYLDATEAPWSAAYRMYSYVTRELPEVIEANFPVIRERRGIFGHSMGGHGALVIALREGAAYRSASAFAPIVTPSDVPWGQKAFEGYLGSDRSTWSQYDAVRLLDTRRFDGTLLVEQGTRDPFLGRQLDPERLREACLQSGQPLELRMREGYDHSYFFIQTFIEDHLRHHASVLWR
ncbi:MAG TPA: S-formylglutathione hydrolase [Polyangiaceae bacterium]